MRQSFGPACRPFILLVLLVLLSTAACPPEATSQPAGLPSPGRSLLEGLPADLRSHQRLCLDLEALQAGYGSLIRRVVRLSPDRLALVMADGRLIPYDDGRVKTPEEKLACPDLEDMLAEPYPLGPPTLRQLGQDPGRIRVEAFFQSVYGSTPAEVQAHLVAVPFLGGSVRFQEQNGAAAALARVGDRLHRLLAQRPSLRAAILPVQGTYNHRPIAGTHRLSPHAWGIAIDLRRGSYWRWGGLLDPPALLALRSAYPQEIVAAFEAEGFIWGGKWWHYDTMHFEYRPELLAKARLAARATPPLGR